MNQKRCFGIAETRVHRLTRMSTAKRTWMSVVSSSNDVFCKAKNSCLRIDTDVNRKPDMDVRGSKQ